MDFYLASDSSPAIHSKTTAKVIKRIGFTKFWVFFLAYLIYFSYLCHQINNNNIKKEVIMQATKNNTKEETIRKFKQLLKHKRRCSKEQNNMMALTFMLKQKSTIR